MKQNLIRLGFLIVISLPAMAGDGGTSLKYDNSVKLQSLDSSEQEQVEKISRIIEDLNLRIIELEKKNKDLESAASSKDESANPDLKEALATFKDIYRMNALKDAPVYKRSQYYEKVNNNPSQAQK